MKNETKSTWFQAMLTVGKKLPIVENYFVAISMAIFSGTFFPEVGALCGTMVGLFRSHGLLNLGHKEALFYIVPCHKEAGKSIFRISQKKAPAFFWPCFL